jgi:hypothetical protein
VIPGQEVQAIAPGAECGAFAPAAEVDALSPFVGGFADPASLWVQQYITGIEIHGSDTFPAVSSSPSLWSTVFGSPDKAQRFLAILDGTVQHGHATECAQGNLISATYPALFTSTSSETGFAAGSKVRLWTKSGSAIRGAGGNGGQGTCEAGGGKVSAERVGGGGGGCGAKTFSLTDPGSLVGGGGD